MLTQIVANTPAWVWLLLVALLWIGLSQTRTRTVSIKKVAILPIIMTILSFSGTVSAFGAHLLTLLAWLGAVAVTFMLWLQALPAPANRFDNKEQKFTLVGSWAPLGLMLGIFMVKYVAGVSTALNPGLARDVNFAMGFSALYGAFSGAFLARATQNLRLSGRLGFNFSRALG
jgi:NADH:ubiquinone oxidoreductase subunit 6 (subunit J)